MIETFEKNDALDDMIAALTQDGVFMVNNFVSNIDPLTCNVKKLCSNGRDYGFGKAYRGPSISKFKNGPILKTFDSSLIHNIYDAYPKAKRNEFGYAVFATHDYKTTPFDQMGRNGYLHWDRIWFLKFMVYCNDVNNDNGAFSCCPGSTALGAKMRSEVSGTADDDKNRLEIDYPMVASKQKLVPIKAKAGTLIVFDTDTFHMGGRVKEGHERLVVRMHCR